MTLPPVYTLAGYTVNNLLVAFLVTLSWNDLSAEITDGVLGHFGARFWHRTHTADPSIAPHDILTDSGNTHRRRIRKTKRNHGTRRVSWWSELLIWWQQTHQLRYRFRDQKMQNCIDRRLPRSVSWKAWRWSELECVYCTFENTSHHCCSFDGVRCVAVWGAQPASSAIKHKNVLRIIVHPDKWCAFCQCEPATQYDTYR